MIFGLLVAYCLHTVMASATDAAPIYSQQMLHDLKRGSRGTCQSVFEDDTIESFDFEVKGLMKNYLGPNLDLVLVKLLGDKTNFTGVVAGMSGSPCMIDGHLLGALSYAFANFAKEPIAGITPIVNMLPILQLPSEAKPWRLSSIRHMNDARVWAAIGTGARMDPAWLVPQQAQGDLLPIATPLQLGGVPPDMLQYFETWFRGMGFEPIAAGAYGTIPQVGGGLAPGSAVSMVLVRGDVDIAATGTVTYVDHGRVLAFGHPFASLGAVSVPMAQAFILNTMVSLQRSYKMAATGAVVGEVTQDRLTGIAGLLNHTSHMIPVAGTVTTPAGKTTFHLEIARDPGLSPMLLLTSLASAISGRIDAGSRGILRLQATINVEHAEPLIFNNVYVAKRDVSMPIKAAFDIVQVFVALWDTKFFAPPAVSIVLQIDFQPDPIEESIDAVYANQTYIKPGDSIDLAVQLSRYQAAPSTVHIALNIPYTWANQEIDIVVAGADEMRQLQYSICPVDTIKEAARYDDIEKALSAMRPNGKLYVAALADGVVIAKNVAKQSFLPPSIGALIAGSNVPRCSRGIAFEQAYPRLGVLTGEKHIKLNIAAY